MDPTFFATRSSFRAWLEKHHATASELLVGYHTRGSGKPSITWSESVDQALCFGWIDGVRRRIDDTSYCIRFTPRTSRSTWSSVNVKRVGELTKLGMMHPSGLTAFEARAEARTGTYSYENRSEARLSAEQQTLFRANPKAWTYFQAQPAWYRTAAVWWVVSAKRAETTARRLATLIDDSAKGRTVGPLTRPGRPTT